MRYAVHDITRSDAKAFNLAATADATERIIADVKAWGGRAIVLVTGVPGAGKISWGVNVATRHGPEHDAVHVVFL